MIAAPKSRSRISSIFVKGRKYCGEYKSQEKDTDSSKRKKDSNIFSGIYNNYLENRQLFIDLGIDITLYKLKCALNSLLPEDIRVIDVEEVEDSFHARFMVRSKKYVYYLNVGEYDPLKRNYIYH